MPENGKTSSLGAWFVQLVGTESDTVIASIFRLTLLDVHRIITSDFIAGLINNGELEKPVHRAHAVGTKANELVPTVTDNQLELQVNIWQQLPAGKHGRGRSTIDVSSEPSKANRNVMCKGKDMMLELT